MLLYGSGCGSWAWLISSEAIIKTMATQSFVFGLPDKTPASMRDRPRGEQCGTLVQHVSLFGQPQNEQAENPSTSNGLLPVVVAALPFDQSGEVQGPQSNQSLPFGRLHTEKGHDVILHSRSANTSRMPDPSPKSTPIQKSVRKRGNIGIPQAVQSGLVSETDVTSLLTPKETDGHLFSSGKQTAAHSGGNLGPGFQFGTATPLLAKEPCAVGVPLPSTCHSYPVQSPVASDGIKPSPSTAFKFDQFSYSLFKFQDKPSTQNLAQEFKFSQSSPSSVTGAKPTVGHEFKFSQSKSSPDVVQPPIPIEFKFGQSNPSLEGFKFGQSSLSDEGRLSSQTVVRPNPSSNEAKALTPDLMPDFKFGQSDASSVGFKFSQLSLSTEVKPSTTNAAQGFKFSHSKSPSTEVKPSTPNAAQEFKFSHSKSPSTEVRPSTPNAAQEFKFSHSKSPSTEVKSSTPNAAQEFKFSHSKSPSTEVKPSTPNAAQEFKFSHSKSPSTEVKSSTPNAAQEFKFSHSKSPSTEVKPSTPNAAQEFKFSHSKSPSTEVKPSIPNLFRFGQSSPGSMKFQFSSSTKFEPSTQTVVQELKFVQSGPTNESKSSTPNVQTPAANQSNLFGKSQGLTANQPVSFGQSTVVAPGSQPFVFGKPQAAAVTPGQAQPGQASLFGQATQLGGQPANPSQQQPQATFMFGKPQGGQVTAPAGQPSSSLFAPSHPPQSAMAGQPFGVANLQGVPALGQATMLGQNGLKPAFQFGTPAATPTAAPGSEGFKFGVPNQSGVKPPNQGPTGFNFGAQVKFPSNDSKPSLVPEFKFGQSDPGFKFGQSSPSNEIRWSPPQEFKFSQSKSPSSDVKPSTPTLFKFGQPSPSTEVKPSTQMQELIFAQSSPSSSDVNPNLVPEFKFGQSSPKVGKSCLSSGKGRPSTPNFVPEFKFGESSSSSSLTFNFNQSSPVNKPLPSAEPSTMKL